MTFAAFRKAVSRWYAISGVTLVGRVRMLPVRNPIPALDDLLRHAAQAGISRIDGGEELD